MTAVLRKTIGKSQRFIALLVIVLFAAMALVPATAAASKPSIGTSPLAGCTWTFTSVSRSSSHSASASYTCTITATKLKGGSIPTNSWASTIFNFTNTSAGATYLTVKVTDGGYIGDYYSVWYTSDKTLNTGWKKVGSTPPVLTGPSLVAPSYNALWTGTGTHSSSGTFSSKILVTAGATVHIAVDDTFFRQVGSLSGPCGLKTPKLVTLGCSTTGILVSANLSPSDLTVAFS